jgi:hypothetical protein
MTAPSIYQDINGTYVTIYARAGDPAGVTFWSTQLAGSVAAAVTTPQTLAGAGQLGVSFYQATPVTFDGLYKADTDTQFINALYNNLGGSNADSAGLSFWLGTLQAAESTAPNVQTARAAIAGEVAFDLLTFNPSTSTGLSPSDLAAATARAAEYANKVAVSQSVASTGNAAFNPKVANLTDPAYNGETAIVAGVTNDPATLAAANAAITAANAANNPALLNQVAQTLTLTTGIDTLTSSNPTATFFSSDVFQSGDLVPTLNPGDNLSDTAVKSQAELSLIAEAGSLSHFFSGFTTTGIPLVQIQNSSSNLLTFDGTQANGLTDITSLNAALHGAIVLQNIENKVALHVTGPVDNLTLNYAAAVTGAQALDLTNAVNYGLSPTTPFTGTEILFGTNAPTSLAVSLTGSSDVNIQDNVLTTIVATSTDTGQTNNLNFTDAGNHTISSANFSAVTGNLTVVFANDSLANGSLIQLGTQDTLTIGNSSGTHSTDIIKVAGLTAGLYTINLGNQNDQIDLGIHNAGDTLNFVRPNTNAFDIIDNANLATDTFNFKLGTFTGSHTLFSFGDVFHGTTTTAVGATGLLSTPDYNAAAGLYVTTANSNVIKDVTAGDNSAAAVQATIRGATHLILFSNTNTTGDFLIAYQSATDVHIADVHVNNAITTFNATVTDLVDLTNQNLVNVTGTLVQHLIHFV